MTNQDQPKGQAELTEGAILIAIDPCVMSASKLSALIVGKEYEIKSIDHKRGTLYIKSELFGESLHGFGIAEGDYKRFFTLKSNHVEEQPKGSDYIIGGEKYHAIHTVSSGDIDFKITKFYPLSISDDNGNNILSIQSHPKKESKFFGKVVTW